VSDGLIVDAHHHLWRPERGYRWLDEPGLERIRRPFTPDELITTLDAAGVGASVLVEGGRCRPDEAAEFLRYAADTKPIVGVVAWIDVAAADVPDVIDHYRRLPAGELLVGLRAQIQGEADPDYLDRPDVRRGLSAIAAAGLVFDLVIRADQLPSAARAAAAVPELSLVLDHLGKPRIDKGHAGLRSWLGPFAALAANANVTCKLSGLVTEAGPAWTADALRPFVAAAVDEFGTARLMFGSDWPVCLLVAEYGQVHAALVDALPPLTGPALSDIFAGTAIRTYGLAERVAELRPAAA
jgi:L-fuconolactonase